MATFKLRQGVDCEKKLEPAGETQVLLLGRQSSIKAAQNGTDWTKSVTEKLGSLVDGQVLKRALSKFEKSSGSMPLYMDLAKIAVVSEDLSRYNSPANGYGFSREVSCVKVAKGVKFLSVVLFTDYASAMASCVAIARCFPLFSLKSKKDNNNESLNVQVELVLVDGKTLSETELNFLDTLCAAVRNCARLVEVPPNILHTEALLDEALSQIDATGAPIEKTIIKGKELDERGFGGIYSVGKASKHPPIFACFSHQPQGATETIALVGKGIVYDTGGLTMKSRTTMPGMKVDMGGAAAMLTAFCSLVKANFKQNLHCLLCIAENCVSAKATRPDDVITMLSGKTVEVNNTDAEGRLVLADGVFYAKNTLKATTIIDMATLTGAQAYATGNYHAAILTNSEELESACVRAGRKSGDLVHPLPYAPELHFGDLSSKVADMKNSNLGAQVGPPSALAGLFVGAHFLDLNKPQGVDGDPRWLHIDMAANVNSKMVGDRSSGFGTTLLCSLLARHTDVGELAAAASTSAN
uniref:CYTOSOL_AP domain-containing protein n=1 Tax=Globodera pallida TaxID=36090 RepID=A0A183CAC4_GLOPA